MRLLPREDHLTSTKVRATNELDCSLEVLGAMKNLQDMRRSGDLRSFPVRFVDVGSNLGDCSLAASLVFPEGSLQALAVDADPRLAPLLEATARLNGLHERLHKSDNKDNEIINNINNNNKTINNIKNNNSNNTSKLIVRPALLGRCPEGNIEKEVVVSLDAHIGVVGEDHEPADFSRDKDRPGRVSEIARVQRACLDHEVLRAFPASSRVDILAIHGNGYFEVDILAGAEALLAERLVKCVLVTCVAHEEDGCEQLEQLLRQFQYRTERRQDWLAASPAADGRRPCYAQDEGPEAVGQGFDAEIHHPDL